MLDPLKDRPEAVISELGGLLLTGGVDVDPARYGEERQPTVTCVEPDRDAFEFGLFDAARGANLPVFGICRGIQVMNVAMGGTLVQDIPTQMAGSLEHTIPAPAFAVAHEIWVSKGSRLWTLMQEKMADGDGCSADCRHHQAVKKVAPGFEVTATAPDGVVEAIECAHSSSGRAVAPGELLADRRVPAVVRGLHRGVPRLTRSRDAGRAIGPCRPERGGMETRARTVSLVRRGVTNLLAKRPFCISFEVTYNCNAQCGHCHLGGAANNPREVRAPAERFGELARRFKPVVAQVSGGEPLLRADIDDIVSAIRVPNRAPFVVLTTNGFLLTRERYERLRKAGGRVLAVVRLPTNATTTHPGCSGESRR